METKIETTFSISIKILEKTDALANKFGGRSEFVEQALQEFILKLEKSEREAKDIEIINQNADELNEEAMDVLDYQFDW